jgi:hypothetical protein
VPDPREYLRKVICVPIVLPTVPRYVLQRQLEEMLGEVSKARGFTINTPPRLRLTDHDWTPLTPTLRHIKQVVNDYSTTMALLADEIDAFDALLATALNQFEPGLFNLIAEDHFGWVTGEPSGPDSLAAAIGRRQKSAADARTETLEKLRKAIDERDPKKPVGAARVGQMMPFINALFQANRPAEEDRAGQHLASWEYFQRFRERAIRPEFIRDKLLALQIQSINAEVGNPDAAEALAADLIRQAKDRRALFDKLIVRAYEFRAEVRLPIIGACAKASSQLAERTRSFEEAEGERARALVFSLLEQGKGEPDWQRQAMVEAIRRSSRLEFARALVFFSTQERNKILTDFTAFSERQLKAVLATTIRNRLAHGYNPFDAEPQESYWVIAAIGNRRDAARWVVRLNGVEQILEAQRPYGRAGQYLETINWDDLTKSFDYKVLQSAVRRKQNPTVLDRLLLLGPEHSQARPLAPPEAMTWQPLRHLCGDLVDWGVEANTSEKLRLRRYLDVAALLPCPWHGYGTEEMTTTGRDEIGYAAANRVWYRYAAPGEASLGARNLRVALVRAWSGTGKRPNQSQLEVARRLAPPIVASKSETGLMLEVCALGPVPEIKRMKHYAVIQTTDGDLLRLPDELFNWALDTARAIIVGGGNEPVKLLPAQVEFGVLDGRTYAEIL